MNKYNYFAVYHHFIFCFLASGLPNILNYIISSSIVTCKIFPQDTRGWVLCVFSCGGCGGWRVGHRKKMMTAYYHVMILFHIFWACWQVEGSW